MKRKFRNPILDILYKSPIKKKSKRNFRINLANKDI